MKYKAVITIESEDDPQKASVQVVFDPPIKPKDPIQPLAYKLTWQFVQSTNPSNISNIRVEQ